MIVILYIVVALLFIVPQYLFCQDTIEADRPGETQATSTLSRKQFQVELGVQKEQQNKHDYFLQHPDASLRFGITNRIELRAHLSEETHKIYSVNEIHHGLEPVEVGLKIKLWDKEEGKFQSSILAQIGIPSLASKVFDPGKAYHKIRLLMENELTSKLKFGYNIGSDWNEEEHHQNWIISCAPQLKLSDHVQVYIEEFSFLQEHSIPQHHLQGGLAYTFGKKIQLDASSGLGLNSASPDYFINAGISLRL
ncbi:MAG: transporter, partial [Chitinophagaceae bacterium]